MVLKRFATIAAALALLSAPAWAADQKITLEQADKVLTALNSLDGHQKIVKDGGQEKVAIVEYELTGNTRKLIAKDIDILTPVVRRFGKVRQGLIKQYLGIDTLPAGDEFSKLSRSDEFKKLTDEIQKQLDAPIEEEVQKINDVDLKLDANPIPPSILAALTPIRIQ